MSVLQAIVLGVIQGITEFLPVSSSGHLELGRLLLSPERLESMDKALLFFVILHVATLVPVFVVFRKDVARVLRGLGKMLGRPAGFLAAYRTDEEVRLFALLVAGMVPTSVVALLLKRYLLDALFAGPRSAPAVGGFFILTAVMLLLSDRVKGKAGGILNVRLTDALLVGTVQGIAAIPGISRSGATISASLAVGMERGLAARFSFLLSIPAILAAALYESLGLFKGGLGQEGGEVFAAAAAASLVGFGALFLVLRLIRRGKLGRFAFYLVPLGVLAIASALRS
ncbi:MAG: undecaprenyl-diphosphate phosphatase [Planctomycetota bacterium]